MTVTVITENQTDIPSLVWSLIYTLISLAIGFMATRVFKLPSWVTPAIAFNNTTSLPLLLIQSLEAAGILSRLLMSDGDTTAEAVKRANSYFLVCAIVGNSLTFALGPKLLDGEHVPDEDDRLKKPDPIQDCTDDTPNDVETGGVRDQGNHGGNQADADAVDEETSLLPDSVVAEERRLGRATDREAQIYWDQFPPWLQPVLDFLYAFINPPIIGAIIGAILGLVPPLHRAFFNETEDGGFFKAWLTTSVQNVGNLFAALQVVVVGSSLSNSLRRMKNGQDSGNIPLLPTLFVFAIRFIIWPLISIPIIWALAARTNLLGNDPVLWFSMCLMPTGPSALKLTALTQVNGSSELEKLTIAKFLTVRATALGED